MTTVFVQFSDSSQTKVQTVFGCAQDPAAWPNQATIADTDPRYLAFINPAGTPAAIKAAAVAALFASYQAACAANVSFTSAGGVTKTYQADQQSVFNLQASLLGCQKAQATPPGFFWVAADNTQVPFTFADLQGLAQAIFEQSAVAFASYQTAKAALG